MAFQGQIKEVNLGNSTLNYEICDEYARRRLEGLSTVYSISCEHTGASTNTYIDYITGDTITFSTMAIANSQFKPSSTTVPDTITITKTTGKTTYIVLESKTTAGAYYAVRFLDMQLGDTVYVVERTTTISGETVNIPDRWLSAYVENTSASFTVLDGKIDLKEYAKKGTYTTTTQTPTVTGSAGAQTATGTATVTYKKADAVTGSAGGETITSSSAGAGEPANTGNAGGATVSGSNFSFGGTAATITSSGSYKPEGTISAVSHPAHTHTVTPSTATATVYTAVSNQTKSAGAHTHTVNVSGDITLGDLAVSQATTGTVTYTPAGTISKVSAQAHSHSVGCTKATVSNNVTGTQTGSSGAHSHDIDVHDHEEDETVIKSVTFTQNGNDTFGQGTLPALTVSNKTVVTGITTNYGFSSSISNATDTAGFYQGVMTHPVVESGVLKWTCVAASSSVTASTATVGSASGWSAGSLPTFTQGAKASLTYTTVTVAGATTQGSAFCYSAGAHTHSLTNDSLTYVSAVDANTGTGGAIDVTPTFSGTGVRLVATAGTVEGSMSGTAESAGAHTHGITVTPETITYVTGISSVSEEGAYTVTPTFTGTTATISVSANYTPAGTIGGSQTIAAHSHSYTKPTAHTHSITTSSHTHSIGLTDTTATGSASVAVSNHTHSMGHTHTVTI